jgi:single-strand DNA-binding protein
MSEHITVRGFVATDPAVRTAQAGFPVGNFRLAATDRRFDRERGEWVDGSTNWFTVNMFRNLALNAGTSLQKGQPVLVTGRLKVRPWETSERSGTAVEIEAETIGHDLSLGTASFARTTARSGEVPGGGQDPAAVTAGGSVVPHTVDPQTGELLDGAGAADGDGAEEGADGDREDVRDPHGSGALAVA